MAAVPPEANASNRSTVIAKVPFLAGGLARRVTPFRAGPKNRGNAASRHSSGAVAPSGATRRASSPAKRGRPALAEIAIASLSAIVTLTAVVRADPATTPAPTTNVTPTTQPSATPVVATAVAPSEQSLHLPTTMSAIVVAANRYSTAAADVGSSVSVISREDIERRQQSSVADVLRGTPSLDIVRSGGPNQVTSVFTRGANSDHTLVLIDGIVANDPSSPARAFDFSSLTTDNIERIEVVRGPQSTLWGSNAIGGVVNIVTKRGEGPLSGYVFGEAGSYHTFREGAGFRGGDKNWNYAFSFTRADSQGFSAADAADGNREADGFGNTTASAKVGFNLTPNFDVDIVARYVDSQNAIDDNGGTGGDDLHRILHNREGFYRVAPHLLLFDGVWEQTFNINYTHYHRTDNDDAFPAKNIGEIFGLGWQNDIHLGKHNVLTGGIDFSEESFDSDTTSRKTADTTGIYLQDQFNWKNKLFVTAGGRFETHSDAGDYTTYRFTGAYLFSTGTKVHGSLGTAFKQPTLFQLFSSFGSPDLKPERSQGFDVGVEQALLGDKLVGDVTYFHNHFRDLIDYDFIANKLQNVNEARTQGIEATIAYRPTADLSFGLSYTYTDTEDLGTGLELLRRAPHKIGVDCNWKYCPKGDINLNAVYYNERTDIDPATFGRTTVGDYTLVNLATSYKIDEHLTLFARVENLLNQHYQEVAGFGTAGISFYGGAKFSF